MSIVIKIVGLIGAIIGVVSAVGIMNGVKKFVLAWQMMIQER